MRNGSGAFETFGVRRTGRFLLAWAAAAGLAAAVAAFAAKAQDKKPATTPEPAASDSVGAGAAAAARDMWLPGRLNRRGWGRGPWRGDMRGRVERHWSFLNEGIPAEYAGLRPPKPSIADISEGGKLYATRCATCHGADGMGNGVLANSLSPSPALLAAMINRPIAIDEFLLWSIADGGEAFSSSMPAFKSDMKREDIWKVIAYMRAGFPETAAANKGPAK